MIRRHATLADVTNRVISDAAGPDGLTVGAAAAHAGVTVRTLHHWDAIGLVSPSERTPGGYRLYTAADVTRIHRVLIYRELGLSLESIGELLHAPISDTAASLHRQRAQLLDHVSRLQQMVASVDRMIEAADVGILLSPEEQVAIFGSDWQPSWVTEAHDRWGHTPQWAQYAENAAGRSTQDWQQIADNVKTLDHDLAAAKRADVKPGTEQANALAQRHRASINAYFHCTASMHVCLGKTYTTNPGYVAHYEAIEPGLSNWLRSIIEANAHTEGIDPDTATWN
jgi:DNA-binding transcriptional MerR regulator